MDFNTIAIGVVGILLYLLIPGFALSLGLFPRKKDLGLTERFGLAAFLGMLTPMILYFNDKNFFVPINQETTYMVLISLTVLGLLAWIVRLKFLGAKTESCVAQ